VGGLIRHWGRWSPSASSHVLIGPLGPLLSPARVRSE